MRKAPVRIIEAPNAKLNHIVEAVGDMRNHDVIQVELGKGQLCMVIMDKLKQCYPKDNFQHEVFTSGGRDWIYITFLKRPIQNPYGMDRFGVKDEVRMYPSGKLVKPFDLKAKDLDIEDIAHHLSRLCRWNGGVPGFYSVAEHSIKVASLLPTHFTKWALLHDAAEAYLGDIARPIKWRFSKVAVAEREILKLIADKFDLVWPVPDEVWVADDIALEEEKQQIANGTLFGNNSEIAKRRFKYAWQAVQDN